MRISDWSSDVCSSDLIGHIAVEEVLAIIMVGFQIGFLNLIPDEFRIARRKVAFDELKIAGFRLARQLLLPDHPLKHIHEMHGIGGNLRGIRSEEHTSELQSLMRISYAVFCLKNKKHNNNQTY